MVRDTATPPQPLDEDQLRALAIAYVARYATSTGKLVLYLRRKLRERGWSSDSPPPIDAIVERCVGLGFIDDALFAESRARGLLRKGFGARRIRQNLQAAGVGPALAEHWAQTNSEDPLLSALRFAMRKKIGPYTLHPADARMQQRWIGQLARSGHGGAVIQHVLAMTREEAEQRSQDTAGQG